MPETFSRKKRKLGPDSSLFIHEQRRGIMNKTLGNKGNLVQKKKKTPRENLPDFYLLR